MSDENAERDELTARPQRGMSIFAHAAGHTPVIPNPGETRICSGAHLQPPMESSRRYNPSGNWKPKPKLKLEAAPPVVKADAPPRTVVTPENDKRFSYADAMNAAATAYLNPIEDSGHEDKQSAPDLPALTNENLDWLILWQFDRTTKHSKNLKGNGPVWLKEGDSWVASQRTWSYVANAVKTGTSGVETQASSISEYIKKRKPELTPDYLKDLLRWTAEKIGNKYIPEGSRLWTKQTESDGTIKWHPSLYSYVEISHLVALREKQDPDNPFKAPSFPAFKKKHGYPSREETNPGMVMGAPHVA